MAKKPRIVVIGAGMAGLTAANKLYTSTGSKDMFELFVVEGGDRIGGRINTSEFCGDRIEMGATWIHGIGGSPVHQIAEKINALESDQPWECMDGFCDEPTTVAEGGFELNASIVDPISTLFKNLMEFAQRNVNEESIVADATWCSRNGGNESVGAFLRRGLDAYWDSRKDFEELGSYGEWSRKLLEESVFAMLENTQRTYTSTGDLFDLDFEAESEYRMFPGEEITISQGYLSIIKYLSSALPPGVVQLDRKVDRIEWQPQDHHCRRHQRQVDDLRPVKIHFFDGSFMSADHVIVTVSLGVLKAGTCKDSGMLFSPPLPSYKTDAISRLGYGVVNKLFLQLSRNGNKKPEFPSLQMVFHRSESQLRHEKIPWWMRRTASLSPIYSNSSVLLSWFAGKEALELETLSDEEIINVVSTMVSSLLAKPHKEMKSENGSNGSCNGTGSEVRFVKVLKTKWGSDPLFLGSYSYVAVGSTGADFDTMAEPLPNSPTGVHHPLQILFAGEATHRTHYSTTHGAYFSGLREANRLLQHYHRVEA
ncbi:putative polyamine oxidase 5 [Hibiscus syriacus]|uniref:Polyamine oxidase 5 n=1 Tax=Hibiscus syriacus TaxID=106335 RepID=A0A6A2Z7X2_HIBSY|nr:probable polyamine oxidase 5 isoform X1 [Hibiscus syriacus]KAE8687550.1 putative polyamine oxidase 5 [Hibiscus syriacus]